LWSTPLVEFKRDDAHTGCNEDRLSHAVVYERDTLRGDSISLPSFFLNQGQWAKNATIRKL
jgi:hypothetical protein